jgi:hypothetical protein
MQKCDLPNGAGNARHPEKAQRMAGNSQKTDAARLAPFGKAAKFALFRALRIAQEI